MNTRSYLFNMRCPRCNRAYQVICTQQKPPPMMQCGDCLMKDVEMIALDITSVVVMQ